MTRYGRLQYRMLAVAVGLCGVSFAWARPAGAVEHSPGAEASAPATETYVGGIIVGGVKEDDPDNSADLDGFRIGFTAVSQKKDARVGHAGTFYFESKNSDAQKIAETGAELSYPYFRFKRLSIGPRYRLAILDRDEPPHRGTEGMVGVGLDLGLWLTPRLQIAFLADRSVGFDSGTRNAYSVNLRILAWGD